MGGNILKTFYKEFDFLTLYVHQAGTEHCKKHSEFSTIMFGLFGLGTCIQHCECFCGVIFDDLESNISRTFTMFYVRTLWEPGEIMGEVLSMIRHRTFWMFCKCFQDGVAERII